MIPPEVWKAAYYLAKQQDTENEHVLRERMRRWATRHKLTFRCYGGAFKGVYTFGARPRWCVKREWQHGPPHRYDSCKIHELTAQGYGNHVPVNIPIGDRVSIQEYCPTSLQKYQKHHSKVQRLARKFRVNGDVSEINVGWRGETPVFFDLSLR